MLAAVIEERAISWAEQPDPVVGTNDLLVQVRAAGLNGADLLQKAGHYPPPPGVPAAIPGLECAGVVQSVGPGVTRFGPGDRVMGLLGGAGQAEFALLHERIAMAIPDGVAFDVAGGFCETFSTAHDALCTQAALGPGERLLVNGAAGGVGVAAVQLARSAGASVVASVRDPTRRAGVDALGAIAIEPGDVGAHGPFDVVLELVGAPNLEEDLEQLAPGGRVVVIGMGAGARTTIDLRQLMSRRARLMSSTLRARPLEEKAIVARKVEHHVVPLLASGAITVPIEERFSFPAVADAYERFSRGGKLGKIVLVG